MTIGTIQGVTDLCGSTNTGLITRQLIRARGRLTRLLLKEGITVPASDVDLDTAAEAIAAALIAQKPGAVDPRTGFSVDGFARKDGAASQVAEFRALAEVIIGDYIVEQTTVASLPAIGIVGRVGRRIGEYEEMEEDEEAEY